MSNQGRETQTDDSRSSESLSQPSKKAPKKRTAKTKAEERIENLSELTLRNGKIFSVSRIHNLDLSEVSTKRYKKIIRERVKGALVSKTGTDYKVNATFETRPELAETNYDHSTVCIEVSVIPPTEDEDGDEEYLVENARTMYLGYLSCRGRDKAYSSVSQLPVLLAFAKSPTLATCLNFTLETLFDCIVRPMELSTHQMELIFTQCLAITSKDDSKIILGLNFPCFGKDEVIEIALRSGNFLHLKKLLKTPNQDDDMVISKKYFDKLYRSLKGSFRVDLQSCTLAKFQLNDIVLHSSGKFLVSTAGTMAVFIKSLSKMSLEKEIRLYRNIKLN